MSIISYDGYEAVVAYDEETTSFHGEVVNLRDVITFASRSVEELKQAFANSIDDYREFCRKRGEEPKKP